MDSQHVIDLSRQALQTVLILSLPILGVALLTGLIVSTLQAMTQIHDQTIGTVAKLFAVVIVLLLCMPWLVEMMTDYSQAVVKNASNVTRSSQ